MPTVAHLRKQLGLSQTAMAKAIGVSQGNVSHYENRGQNIPPEVAAKIVLLARSKGVELTLDDIYAAELKKAELPKQEAH